LAVDEDGFGFDGEPLEAAVALDFLVAAEDSALGFALAVVEALEALVAAALGLFNPSFLTIPSQILLRRSPITATASPGGLKSAQLEKTKLTS
jgi:hypothetical protein